MKKHNQTHLVYSDGESLQFDYHCERCLEDLDKKNNPQIKIKENMKPITISKMGVAKFNPEAFEETNNLLKKLIKQLEKLNEKTKNPNLVRSKEKNLERVF